MNNLSQNQRSFIQAMTKSLDHERHGFDLLLKREHFDVFFDALKEQGLFSPVRNPRPIVVDAAGSVQIPYWGALDYLTACAKRAGEKKDEALAAKVITVVRAVSTAAEGGITENFHTARKFAEIVGILPTNVVTEADIDLIPKWLSARFEHGMVAAALDQHALRAFLASPETADWKKAVQILRHCTQVRWETKQSGFDETKPVAVADDYCLNELIMHHADAFGRRIPAESAKVLEQGVRDVFNAGGRENWSYIHRAAVEEHEQNHSWNRLENSLIAGLRDVVLRWCEADGANAKEYVRHLLHSDVEMLRRIGIYVLNERWPLLDELYAGVVGPSFFNSGHLHELYGLLKTRFEAFGEQAKKATIDSIRNIPAPEGADSARRLRIYQLRWLSALSNTAYKFAADWLAELEKDSTIGVPTHPDFNTYIETGWGPGPSPYQVAELVAFAEEQTLVEKLKGFKPSQSWHGPSVEALVDTLQKAVAASPDTFIRILPKLLDAPTAYQHGVIRGFKALWDASNENHISFDWNAAWPSLIAFFEGLTGTPGFWESAEQLDHEYSRSWLVSAIADFLRAGTRDDAHAYHESLLPRTVSLIDAILEHIGLSAEADDSDPMTHAINTTKGRSLEALFNHALRSCRVSDEQSGSHDEVWKQLQPLFDRELKKSSKGNYEFSTLAGAYLANLDYMNAAWVRDSLEQIFPAGSPINFNCAVSGLAYSAPTRHIYLLLRDSGVIDRALRQTLKGRDTRKKLSERIMVGYLWGEETLDSPRVAYSFKNNLAEDLEHAAWFFWSIRGEKLSDAQLNRIIDFWAECDNWAKKQGNRPTKLFAALGHLAWVMKDADGRNRDLLLAVAPHMHMHHNVYELLEELNRLVEVSPAAVGDVLRTLVDTGGPVYDYEDRIKKLILSLAERGQKETALYSCNKLIMLPGMEAVFKEITA